MPISSSVTSTLTAFTPASRLLHILLAPFLIYLLLVPHGLGSQDRLLPLAPQAFPFPELHSFITSSPIVAKSDGLWTTLVGALRSSSSRNHPRNKTQLSRMSFPRNLHGVYDGEWKVSGPSVIPFQSIPLTLETRNGTEQKRNRPSKAKTSVTKNWAFTKKHGFALLTVENYRSRLGADINVVVGELLLRDGFYRSPHDINMHVMGIYEWKAGKIVVIGDVYREDPASALERLYHSFSELDASMRHSHASKRNISREAFVTALSPVFVKHHNHAPSQAFPGLKPPDVKSQCPFSAIFSISPSQYSDTPPAAELYSTGTMSSSSLIPGRPESGISTGPIDAATVVSRDLVTKAFQQRQETRNALPKGTESAMSSTNWQVTSVEMRGVFSSRVCKTELTLKLTTLDTDALFGKAINYTLLVTFVAFTQVLVLIRQMEMTSTQAGASRVSLMTVGLQAVADSYLCLAHLTMGIAVQTLFNAFATAAFFKFIIFSIFEMRYMLLIWKARHPSGFSEGWDAMRRELSLLYSRFYGSLLLGIFLLYQLQNHLRLFIFALYSFWVPQIIFSAYEDHRRPLHLLYIVGMSLTRIAIPLYFWSCPRNFLHIRPQSVTAAALFGWVSFQSIILLTQHKFGARWFVPKTFLPEKYDYYRKIDLSEYDIEGQPLTAHVEENEEGNKVLEVDCVICMGRVKLRDSDRMATPCNHCFHAQCLQNWLDIKMECPTCRRTLPPP